MKTLGLPKLSVFLSFSFVLCLVVQAPLRFGPGVQDLLGLLDLLFTIFQDSLSPIYIFLDLVRDIVVHFLFSHLRTFGFLGSASFWHHPAGLHERLATCLQAVTGLADLVNLLGQEGGLADPTELRNALLHLVHLCTELLKLIACLSEISFFAHTFPIELRKQFCIHGKDWHSPGLD